MSIRFHSSVLFTADIRRLSDFCIEVLGQAVQHDFGACIVLLKAISSIGTGFCSETISSSIVRLRWNTSCSRCSLRQHIRTIEWHTRRAKQSSSQQ